MNTLNINGTVNTKDHDGYKRIVKKERIWFFTKEQGDIVYCNTPNGPSDDFEWTILLINWFTGSEYRLKATIRGRIEGHNDPECEELYYMNGRNRADRLIEQMKKAGTVNLDNWVKVK